jgi:peptide/nickel transport system ATP-binding protein
MSPTPLLEARDLVKDFGSTRVIHGVSLNVNRGETLGLVGESGSGKSTIARLLLRLIEPTSGSVLFHDTSESTPHTYDLLHLNPRAMRRLRRRLSIVFQDPYAALNPRMSVRQILAEPFAIHREQPPQGSGSHAQNLDARLHELLSEVGLDPSALRRYPHEFSGGQRQRINIARAIALRPELLVLDEPVSALDVSVGAQVINLLRDLQQRYGLTYLFISHSMPLVRYLCHRVTVMQHGRIVETGTWSEVCDSPRDPYTQQLLAATPELPIPVELYPPG